MTAEITAGTRARWMRLIPIAFITYSLAYVDRANYSFGAAAGLAKDLNITERASSLLGALFFLGYFFFQIPAAHYAEKCSAKRLIVGSLIAWGVFASGTGLITDVRLLYVDRFFLGIAESVVLPGMLILISHWFTSSERSRASTFLILGNPVTVLWMSVVSGYLVNSFGWRGMFIIEGAPPILWAIVVWFLVDDEPRQAKWLDPAERTRVDRGAGAGAGAPAAGAQLRRGVPQAADASARRRSISAGASASTASSCGSRRSSRRRDRSASSRSAGCHRVPYLLAAVLMIVASFYSDHTGQPARLRLAVPAARSGRVLWVVSRRARQFLAEFRCCW